MYTQRQKATIRQTKASMKRRARRALERLDLSGVEQRGVERGGRALSSNIGFLKIYPIYLYNIFFFIAEFVHSKLLEV